uniref:Uncharacterized protein n=1 Tax=Oryza brachyantha TaxID=4533 RepID=J3M0X7_ORYBR
MGRSPCCCHDAGVKKGPWTEEEDRALVEHIKKQGGHVGSWRSLPRAAGLNRCGKSCRLRWTNYLRPDIKRGNFSDEEERLIVRLHAALGNKWSTIATHLDGRTDNEIKNYWNTHIKKKLLRMGIDPLLSAINSNNDVAAGLMGMANLAATNAMVSPTSTVANHQPSYLCDVPSFSGQDMAEQQRLSSSDTTAPPVLIRSSAEPVDHQCCNDAALVPETYPQGVTAIVDWQMQEFSNLEPLDLELPNLCSLESDLDPFWRTY